MVMFCEENYVTGCMSKEEGKAEKDIEEAG